jgi:hypothetical protein
MQGLRISTQPQEFPYVNKRSFARHYRHEVAERTTAFRFEKPSNWTFKSGQYLDCSDSDSNAVIHSLNGIKDGLVRKNRRR